MLEFASEEVRTEFHLLPLDRQREVMQMAQAQFYKGFVTTVVWVDIISSRESEVMVRIDKKFDSARVVGNSGDDV